PGLSIESSFVARVLKFERVMCGSSYTLIGLRAQYLLQCCHSAVIVLLEAHAPYRSLSYPPVCFSESHLDEQANEIACQRGWLAALASHRMHSHAAHTWSRVMERHLLELSKTRISPVMVHKASASPPHMHGP